MVRVYSTLTGEWIRDLDGPNAQIIGTQYDQQNAKILYACTETGEVVSWKWRSGVVHEKIVRVREWQF